VKNISLTQQTRQEIYKPSPIIKNIIRENLKLITKIENDFQIPNRYLIPHLAINLPKFSREKLNTKVVSQEAIRLANKKFLLPMLLFLY